MRELIEQLEEAVSPKKDWQAILIKAGKKGGVGSVSRPRSLWDDSPRRSFEFSAYHPDAKASKKGEGYQEPRVHISFRIGNNVRRDPQAQLRIEGVGYKTGADVKTWKADGQDLPDDQWKAALAYLKTKLK